MKAILLIAIGGGVGAVFRFLLSKGAQTLLGFTFPYGTLAVNIIGSFLIGLISIVIFEHVGEMAQDLRSLLIVGLLGGFTTFSSFSLETVSLWENRELFKTGLYLIFSVALCLVATWCGLTLGRRI